MSIDTDNLRQFLLTSNKKGYAATGETAVKKETNGSKTITYSDGDWSSSDNYFGGEPYGGRSVIFLKGKPVWMMVYYGAVDEKFEDFASIYSFLRKALLKSPEEYPFRGPSSFEEGEFNYENFWEGDVESFSGREKIYFKGKEVFYTKYAGGLINLRED